MSAVETPPDPLDSCAYSILVALFSLVEHSLEEQLTDQAKKYYGNAIKKTEIGVWQEHARAAESSVEESSKFLAKLVPAKDCSIERLGKNEKLAYVFSQVIGAAKSGNVDLLRYNASRFRANVALANEPGDQCIAVVMDAKRDLYVAGNGLWALEEYFPSGESIVTAPNWNSGKDREKHFKDVAWLSSEAKPSPPWFRSAAATKLALEMISPDMIGEYTVRKMIYISPTKGDSKGRFHAEMQLLDYIIANDILPVRSYVGVSKPCCAHCATALRSAGLRFWTEHGARGKDPRTDENVARDHIHFRNAGLCEAFRKKLAGL